MKDETALLFRMVGCAVTGREPDEELAAHCRSMSEDEWLGLYALAGHHDLAHLVGDVALRRELLPEGDARKKFQKAVFLAVSRVRSNEYELARVGALLSGMKIPYIPLKGAVLRGLYREPWYRTSCDIDILVEQKNLRAALDALHEKLGYSGEEEGPHDVALTAPGGVRLELHYRLIEEEAESAGREALPLADPFSQATAEGEDAYRMRLSPEVFYYYHICHMAKHFENGGCGIRPFLDLYVMRSFSYEEEKKQSFLAKGGLEAFARAAEKLSSVWLGFAEHDDLTRAMEEYILTGGTYGNLQNKAKLRTAKEGIIRYFASRVFLPYEELRLRYPALGKHKWLLPFFEVRRWFERLFSGKARRAAAELSAVSSENPEDVKKIRTMLGDLGLTLKD